MLCEVDEFSRVEEQVPQEHCVVEVTLGQRSRCHRVGKIHSNESMDSPDDRIVTFSSSQESVGGADVDECLASIVDEAGPRSTQTDEAFEVLPVRQRSHLDFEVGEESGDECIDGVARGGEIPVRRRSRDAGAVSQFRQGERRCIAEKAADSVDLLIAIVHRVGS